MRLLSKYLHEVGSYGLAGGFAAQLIFLSDGDMKAAAVPVQAIGGWLVTPSLILVLLSGVLAMVVRPTFFTKGWVWMKVILTIPTIYATLATFPGIVWYHELKPSQLWLALIASLVVTAFSVWRPRGFLIPDRRVRRR